jgi:hypothetical protein
MPRLSRRDLLLASGASVLTYATGAAGAPTAFSTPTSTRLDPDFTFLLRGIDLIDDVLYASDLDNHAIRQSDDWAATWSAPKPLPPNSVADQVTRVIRHNDMAFCAGRDTARARLSVWRAPLADGDTPFQWVATPLSAQDFTSAKSGTQFTHDERYLYPGEYGNPPNGPNLYRSLDGTTWETVFSKADQLAAIGRTARHIHAVAVDPYNAGHVYFTTGDFGVLTGAALWRSTQGGDPGTWEVVPPTGRYQSSQISFDADTIWLAADNHVDTAVVATTDIGNTEGMFAIPAIGPLSSSSIRAARTSKCVRRSPREREGVVRPVVPLPADTELTRLEPGPGGASQG